MSGGGGGSHFCPLDLEELRKQDDLKDRWTLGEATHDRQR